MSQVYARDFDLNLLRVFVVVAEAGSVTAAAEQLYLTQPAISAALRRLTESVGAPLFARAGRGLSLTTRGKALLQAAQPHLAALVGAALSPAAFAPQTSEEVVRIGISDLNDAWLLPPLLRMLRDQAPRLKLVVLPVQFRTLGDALLAGKIDLAITVADDLPAGMKRAPLFYAGFTCLYDPRSLQFPKKPSLERYLAEEHVIVSYNGDLRGVVEDILGLHRRVRISVPSFAHVGPALTGTGLVATVPTSIARELMKTYPHLRCAEKPFQLSTNTPMELVWRGASEGNGAIDFVRQHIAAIAAQLARPKKKPKRARAEAVQKRRGVR